MNQIFTVEGMTCGHCEKTVSKALLFIDPNAKVTIDLAQKMVVVESNQPREVLAKAITEEGYTVAT